MLTSGPAPAGALNARSGKRRNPRRVPIGTPGVDLLSQTLRNVAEKLPKLPKIQNTSHLNREGTRVAEKTEEGRRDCTISRKDSSSSGPRFCVCTVLRVRLEGFTRTDRHVEA